MSRRKKRNVTQVRRSNRVVTWVILIAFVSLIAVAQATTTSTDSTEAHTSSEQCRTPIDWSEESYRASFNDFQLSAESFLKSRDVVRSSGCFRAAAQLAFRLNLTVDAEQLLLRSLEISKGSNVDPNGEIEALSHLIMVTAKDSRLEKSKEYKDRIEAISHLGDRTAAANAHFAFAEYYYRKDRNITLMIENQEKALLLFRESGDKFGETLTMTELAYSFVMNNEREKGRLSADEAVRIARSNNDLRGLAFALIALGDTHQRIGEWQHAVKSFKEAERYFPMNVDLLESAILFDRLGVYHQSHADVAKATDYYTKALERFRKINNLYGVSELLTVLGQLSIDNGDHETALHYFQEGLAVSRQSNDVYSASFAKENIGDAYYRLNDDDTAFVNFIEALKGFEKVGIDHAVASVHQRLGLLFQRQGRTKLSRKHFETALDINLRISSKEGQAMGLANLAKIDYVEGQLDRALSKTGESIKLTEYLQNTTANSKLKRGYVSGVSGIYELQTLLLMKRSLEFRDSGFTEQALQVAERSRTRTMVENLTLSEQIADADPDIVKKEKEIRIIFNTKSDKLTELLSDSNNETETQGLENEVDDLEHQLEELRAELKQNSPIYSAIKNPEPFDVAEFQREILGTDDLLLEFSLGKEESYLWAVDKTSVTAYYLPPRDTIESRVNKLRSLLGERKLRESESLEDYRKRQAIAEIEYTAESRALSTALLGQVAADKIAGKRLIVVADGRLHYFPLGSLPMPNSDSDAPILITNEVVYSPSASALKILRIKKKDEVKPQKDLLVFADPVFSTSDERVAGLGVRGGGFAWMTIPMFRSINSLESLPRLPASSEEARSISEVIGAGQTTLRAGFAANRDGVLNGGIEDYKVLHFATHGRIHEERPQLSGIVLSLYTDEGKQNEGGFIRLQDVYALRLNSDLVVLSACDTGIGKEIRGEGVMSLNNAFLQAGARSVVSTLWKVDDTATKDLMTEFYRGMADDELTASAALRQAQIKMFNDPRYRSPFYWAAFTASGDTKVKVEFASNMRIYISIAAALLAVALMAFLGFQIYRRNSLQRSALQ